MTERTNQGAWTLGIDASNLRAGGGVTHLTELLSAARPAEHGVARVIVWGSQETLGQLPARQWLEPVVCRSLQRPLPFRILWQQFLLPRTASAAGCDVLFAPGGIVSMLSDLPTVAMSQNLLPFDAENRRKYGLTRQRVRYFVLRHVAVRSFLKADVVIFLTDFARDLVTAYLPRLPALSITIPHGVSEHFRLAPRAQEGLDAYGDHRPFRILYVSTISPYKNHALVIEAIAALRAAGLPVQLDLVGTATKEALSSLISVTRRHDPGGSFVRYLGAVPHSQIHRQYHSADLFVFASTSETISITLLEAMAAGLPIASSSAEPMASILGNGGALFDAEDAQSLRSVLENLVNDPGKRTILAKEAFARAADFSWPLCAEATFNTIASVALRANSHRTATKP